MADDPFPLFHLSDLDFDVSAERIPLLPAYQLALAPWSTAWSDSLEPALKRTWRRKRERARTQITNKVPYGKNASEQDRQREQFPKFELIPLDFDLSAGEAALDGLTSAQLAAIQFHPSGTKELVFAAEDIFFSRRERDFAAGLSLPPFVPEASTSASNGAPSATAPVVPVVQAAQPAVAPANIATPAVASIPAAPPPDVPAPVVPAPVVPAPAAPAPVVAQPVIAQPVPPPTAPVAAAPPPPLLSPGTKQRELERAEYRRRPQSTEAAARADKSAPAPSESSASRDRDRDRDGDRKRGDARSRSRERRRDRSRSRDRDRDRDRREREKERDRERDREREKARSRRSSRERSDRDRDRDRERERDRDRDRDRNGDTRGRRSSGRDRSRSRSRSLDRSALSRRLAEEKRLLLDGRGRDGTDGRDRVEPSSSSASAAAGAAYRKRAPSPAASEASLRSSIRRRLDESADNRLPISRRTPPPQMPLPAADIPPTVQYELKTVFLRHFPGQLQAGEIEAWIRELLAKTHYGAVFAPVGIKASHRRNTDRTPGQDPWVTLAFVAYRHEQEATAVVHATNSKPMNGRTIIASWSTEVNKKHSWKWSDFTPEFVEEEHRRALAAYAGVRSAPGVMPPPQHPMASSDRPGLSSNVPRAGASEPATTATELPDHLVGRLAVLYVTNLPQTTDLSECRNFFDVCDHLVGLALVHSSDGWGDAASAWLAFETDDQRDKAKHTLYGEKYPGSFRKLWLEKAEDHARKSGEAYVWKWSDMSKGYRQQHATEYERVRAFLPQSPTMTRRAAQPFEPVQSDSRASQHVLYPTAMPMAMPPPLIVPSSGYGGPATGYAGQPAYGMQLGAQATPMYAYEQQAPGYAAVGPDQAYSPMQPLLPGPYSAVPRPPASFVNAPSPAQLHSPHVSSMSTPVPPHETPSGGFAASSLSGGHINPARLAMLQASLDAAGYSSGPPNPSLPVETRPDAATQKQQVEEATRGAWSNVRRQSEGDDRAAAAGSSVVGSTLLHVKGTASQGGQTPIAQPSSSIAGSDTMSGRQEGEDAVPRPAAQHESDSSSAPIDASSQIPAATSLNEANGSGQDLPTPSSASTPHPSSAGTPQHGLGASQSIGERSAEQQS